MGKSRPWSISISANQIREFDSSQSLWDRAIINTFIIWLTYLWGMSVLCGLSSQFNLTSEYVEILDQLGALSTNSLPFGYICTCHLCWEGLPWATQCGWDHQCLLWTSKPDGKVWSSSWQVHGVLSAVSRWCCTQRCQCCHRHHQD